MFGGFAMTDYQKMYLTLFNAITNAVMSSLTRRSWKD